MLLVQQQTHGSTKHITLQGVKSEHKSRDYSSDHTWTKANRHVFRAAGGESMFRNHIAQDADQKAERSKTRS